MVYVRDWAQHQKQKHHNISPLQTIENKKKMKTKKNKIRTA